MKKLNSLWFKKHVNLLFVFLMAIMLTVPTYAAAETEAETVAKVETEISTEVTTEAAKTEVETEVGGETEAAAKETEVDFSEYPYDDGQAVALAQLMWAEARGCTKREQSLVAWTVLNRVDVCYSGLSDFWSILTQPDQFAYWSSCPYEEYEHQIAIDVLQRWAAEKDGVESSGRTLPHGYLYYYGDGVHNYFSTNGGGSELYFGLGDPYENW